MNLSKNGTDTLINSVTNITSHGFWVIVNETEYFVSFNEYPGFRKASVDSIFNMTILSPGQLNWLDLDIDIELDALKDPDKFPLQFKV